MERQAAKWRGRLVATLQRHRGLVAFVVLIALGAGFTQLYTTGSFEFQQAVNGVAAPLIFLAFVVLIGGSLVLGVSAGMREEAARKKPEPLVLVKKYDGMTPGGVRKKYETDAQALAAKGYFPVTDSNDPGMPLMVGFGQAKTVTYRKEIRPVVPPTLVPVPPASRSSPADRSMTTLAGDYPVQYPWNAPAQPPATASPDAAPSPVAGLADRLTALKDLKDRGLIDDAEYASKRAELLSRL